MSTTNFPCKLACTALAIIVTLGAAGSAAAGNREQAKRIHDRLAGVPPSATVLSSMETLVASGSLSDKIAAANLAMDNPEFYRVTLKNFITPWTNEEQTTFAPLNDYTATVIGIIRDDVDFREILSGDILYTGNGITPAYSNTNNSHYQAMDDQGADLKTVLTATAQSAVTGLPTEATAGVLTTRAAAKAFFVDGTNRAQFRFTMLNHLCNDMEQVKETSYTPDRIRQDVSRSPGGDSRIYMNACIGCHTGMDPLTQAFAYYDYDYPVDGNGDPDFEAGQLAYNDVGIMDTDKTGASTGTRVQAKYLQNANNFEYGYITPDDQWDNYWRTGPNSVLGWDPALTGSGFGAKTMGRELAHSQAFARCQVEKVFKTVCLRAPVDAADRTQIDSMIASFSTSGYRLKQVFAESAVFCMGD
ncbi:MAG: hypothetical protein GXP17_03445 [Gammaproteobacteria bacterium]|nr:hypothetical protein [Gammaproteobacteria bacterium]